MRSIRHQIALAAPILRDELSVEKIAFTTTREREAA